MKALSPHTLAATHEAPHTRRFPEPEQYTSIAFTGRLAQAGADPSVGSVGDAYDNALAETTIGLYKTELIKAEGPWRDLDQVEAATLEWVHWYNTERTHEAIGDLTPVAAEQLHYRFRATLEQAG